MPNKANAADRIQRRLICAVRHLRLGVLVMEKRVRVRSTRTLPTYTRLRGVSWHAFQLAQTLQKGSFYHLMTSMLFSAFTIEAYLNHLGETQIPYWEPLKRKLSPRDKLDVLAAALGFQPDFGKRPFQTFHSIFKLRDLLVHAKSETLTMEGEFILAEGESPPKPLTEWEELISIDGARRFLDDTKEIVTQVSGAAGLDPEKVFASEVLEVTTELISDITMPSS